MPWPAKALRQFQAIPPHAAEKECYGAFSKLLCTLFPPDTDFTVVPQYLQPASHLTINFSVMLDVGEQNGGNKPVLIMELKKAEDVGFVSTRQAADEQIRQGLSDLIDLCPLQTLHAISIMGTKMCFYRMDATASPSEITPKTIPRHPTRVNDTAPASRWGLDLLEPEGEAMLRQVVSKIKAECEDIL